MMLAALLVLGERIVPTPPGYRNMGPVRFGDRPDAGIWELRGATRGHTFSSGMCWTVCDRLARRLGFSGRADYWRGHAVAQDLEVGDYIFRYVDKDDFGEPENAFLICAFSYVNALAAMDRRDEARALFEKLLACRDRRGPLTEHIDPGTGEVWGNFVQTYSMAGLINSAIRPSIRWGPAFWGRPSVDPLFMRFSRGLGSGRG